MFSHNASQESVEMIDTENNNLRSDSESQSFQVGKASKAVLNMKLNLKLGEDQEDKDSILNHLDMQSAQSLSQQNSVF